MIPLLIPRSRRENVLMRHVLAHLESHFQVREIDDSPATPGDIVFPSLGLACLVSSESEIDDTIVRASQILQRRRCLVLVPSQDMWSVQLRYSHQVECKCRMAMEFDSPWGCVLSFDGGDELAQVIVGFVKGITSEVYSTDGLYSRDA